MIAERRRRARRSAVGRWLKSRAKRAELQSSSGGDIAPLSRVQTLNNNRRTLDYKQSPLEARANPKYRNAQRDGRETADAADEHVAFVVLCRVDRALFGYERELKRRERRRDRAMLVVRRITRNARMRFERRVQLQIADVRARHEKKFWPQTTCL